MSRYLTPSKLCLLCLTSVYCEGRVAKDATMTVLSFLVSHLNQKRASSMDSDFGKGIQGQPQSIEDFCETLRDLQSTIDGTSITELLISRLWGFISGIDGLYDFFGALTWMLDTDALKLSEDRAKWESMRRRGAEEYIVKLSTTSLLGTFVRKCQLEFARLQLEDIVNLWRSFQIFRNPTRPIYLEFGDERWLAHEDSEVEDLNRKSGGKLFSVAYPSTTEPKPQWIDSLDDAQNLLEFQVDKMQKFGIRLPGSMRNYLSVPLDGSISAPNLSFYLRFLDAWYSGDFHASFEYLHRYYDYAIHSRDRSLYQYALLNMAILQADFGCISEAMAAIKETIATARENKDMTCLNFSLNWLYHFSKLHPTDAEQQPAGGLLGSEQDALTFLKAKSRSPAPFATPMFDIWSSALLSEAQLWLSKGDRGRDAFVNIYQSSHLNLVYNLPGVMGNQLLMQSLLFGRLGTISLSMEYCKLVCLYSEKLPAEDTVRAWCRIAYMRLLQGKYEQAFEAIDSAPAELLCTLKLQRSTMAFRRVIELKRLIYHDDLDAADTSIASLKASPLPDPDLEFQLEMLELDLHVRRRSYSDAFTGLAALLAKHESGVGDVHQKIILCCFKASLFCSCGRPQKGLSLAVRAVTAAWQAKIVPALWEASAILIRVLMSLEEISGASKILDAILPQVPESGDYALCASLESLSADRYMSLARDAATNPYLQKQKLTNALGSLQKAYKFYKAVEDVNGEQEIVAKISVVRRLLGGLEAKEATE